MAIQGVSKLETPNFAGTNWATSPQEYSPEVKDYLARLDAEAAKRGEGYYNPLIVQGEMNNGDASMPAYATDSYLRQFIDKPIEQNLGYAYAPEGKWGSTGLVSAGPGTKVVLMDDKTGKIAYQGTGIEGAKEAQRRVDAMGGKAPWSIYSAPEGTDDYYRWAQNEPQLSPAIGIPLAIAGPAIMAGTAGLGNALAAAAATAGTTTAAGAGAGLLAGMSDVIGPIVADFSGGLTAAGAAGLGTAGAGLAGLGSTIGNIGGVSFAGGLGGGIGGSAFTDVLGGGAKGLTGADLLNLNPDELAQVINLTGPAATTGVGTGALLTGAGLTAAGLTAATAGGGGAGTTAATETAASDPGGDITISAHPPPGVPPGPPPIVLNPFDPAVDTLDLPSTPIDTSAVPKVTGNSVLDKLGALSLADKIKLAQGVFGLGSSIFSGGGDKGGDTPAGYGGNTAPVDYDAAVAAGARKQRPSTFDPFTYGQPQGNQPGQFQFFEKYADGGEVEPTLLDRAAQAYPFVKQYSPVIVQGIGEGDSETWRAGEPGDKAHPRPGGAPIDKLAVEFYGEPSEQGLAGELMHVDAKANATRETLRRTMTHEQIERLKRESGDYQMSIQRGMSEEDAIRNALDGAVRGYVIGQWPEDANQRMGYDKKQRKALDDLKQYVTGAPAKAEGGGIGDAQDHARAYAQGGGHDGAGPVAGIGGGQEDKIPAWLSDGEYVWSAQDVSDLGDGSTNEGVRRLDKMRAQVRRQAGRKDVKKIAKPQAGIGDLMAGAV